jgi:hypothetical protein
MKIVIRQAKPRNPHVVAAKARQAGAHGAHNATRRLRRQEKHALRRVLNRPERNDYDE